MRRSPTAVAVVPSEEEAPASGEALRTEFAFTLPRGYVDAAGTVHRDGVMRLATARDELVPLRDDRVRENPAYLTVVLLARVVRTWQQTLLIVQPETRLARAAGALPPVLEA